MHSYYHAFHSSSRSLWGPLYSDFGINNRLDFSLPHTLRSTMERLRNEMDKMRAQMGHLMMKIQVLTHDHGVLKEENGQLKTQMSLIMEVLKTVLRKGNDDVPSTTKVVDLFPPYGSLPIQGMPQRVLSQPQVAKFPRQPVHVPKMSQKGQVYGQRPK